MVAFGIGLDQRPELFELVDHEHETLAFTRELGGQRDETVGLGQPRAHAAHIGSGGDAGQRGFELRQWCGPGHHGDDEIAAPPELGHRARVHEGALAGAGRTDHGNERLRVDGRHELSDERVATAKIGRVGLPECAQAFVRIGADCRHSGNGVRRAAPGSRR